MTLDNVIDIEAKEAHAAEQSEVQQKPVSELRGSRPVAGDTVDIVPGGVFPGDTPTKADAAKKTAV